MFWCFRMKRPLFSANQGLGRFVRFISFSNLCLSFVRQPDGTLTFLNFSSADQMRLAPMQCQEGSNATAINAQGEIVGTGGSAPYHGFVCKPDGTTIWFDMRPEDGSSLDTGPQALNARGQITGFYLKVGFAQMYIGASCGSRTAPSSGSVYLSQAHLRLFLTSVLLLLGIHFFIRVHYSSGGVTWRCVPPFVHDGIDQLLLYGPQ